MRGRFTLFALVLGLSLLLVPVAATFAQTQPPGVEPGEKYHLLFATSEFFAITTSPAVPPAPSEFGSLAGGDWNVTFAAFVAGRVPGWNGLELIYQAILSINGNNARDRIAIEGKIFNTHFDLLANDLSDLWDGSLATAVDYDEFGNLITTSTDVWTGTNISGFHSSDSCGDWNSPLGANLGSIGNATGSGNNWINFARKSCDESARLYGISPAITLPDSADFNGDNVVDGLDFLTLQQTLGTVGPLATHANGDANGDDFINDADLAVWEAQYGNTPPISAVSAAIPEPTTCTLALAALCLAMSRRRGF